MRWKPPKLRRFPGLLVPGTLDLYILKRYLAIYAGNLFSFTLIYVLVDTVTHFDGLLQGQQGLSGYLSAWLSYYSAMVPVIFCQVLGPVVSVSAALFAVTSLHRSNEFTPILASGRSYQRALLPILGASLAISAGVFLVQEVWIPRTVSAIVRVRDDIQGEKATQHVHFYDEARGQLIVFKKYRSSDRRAEGVVVLPISRTDGDHFLMIAASAEWIRPEVPDTDFVSGYWLLRDGTVQQWDRDYRLVAQPPPRELSGAPRQVLRRFVEMPLVSGLLPQDLEQKEVVQMSLAELRSKARSSAGQNTWLVRYYSRFAYAATNFTLVLIGLPIVVLFGNRNMIIGALLAVAIATLYFVMNSVCQDLGVQGYVSPALGGGLAQCVFISLGCTLYRELRS